MNEQQKIKARELAIALSHRYADLSEVRNWSDSQIASSDKPDMAFIDLSLSQNSSEALSLLNALSEGINIWLVMPCFLSRFCSLTSTPPDEALRLAEYLYYVSIKEDAPARFRGFVSHWDAIGLAIEGIYGEPDGCIRDFLKDVRHAADCDEWGNQIQPLGSKT